MKISIQPRVIEANSSDPYKYDLLNRKSMADVLTNLVQFIDDSAVIAVDGEWGSGKTTFLRMWSQQLRKNGIPVVMFNAWETDFSSDPLIVLTSELLNGFQEYSSASTLKTLKEKSKFLVEKLIVSNLTRLVRLSTGGLLEIDQELLKQLGQANTAISSDRLRQYAEGLSAIKEFKSALENTVGCLSNNEERLSVVILVDELDRCRPTYAIELLEAAKHLFSARGVIFVLGVNTSQLVCSVNALYGSKFDSIEYLKRFFNLDVRLPSASTAQIVEHTLKSLGIDSITPLIPHSMGPTARSNMRELLSDFFDLRRLDYRSVEQALRRLGLVFHSLEPGREAWRPFLVVLLI